MSDSLTDPYHEGERWVQEQTGERNTALSNGRNIGEQIPTAAKAFVAQQHYCFLGWADTEGQLWASFLAGPQGFATTDKCGKTLDLALADEAGVLRRIPPLAAVDIDDHIGALFVELTTRRRLRVNGRVKKIASSEFAIAVDHAYALCPKYIQRRKLAAAEENRRNADISVGEALTDPIINWIASADIFFVASAHPDGPTDVSHRGGKPGFVQVEDGVLTIPDYPGNSMFNTLGNLLLNPNAGLVFVDFGANRQLQLTGTARLDLDAGDIDGATGGTGRWWQFSTDRWITSPLNYAFQWEYIDESPFNP